MQPCPWSIFARQLISLPPYRPRRSGEEVIIACRQARRAFDRIPGEQASETGIWKGRVEMSPDFDEIPDAFSRIVTSPEELSSSRRPPFMTAPVGGNSTAMWTALVPWEVKVKIEPRFVTLALCRLEARVRRRGRFNGPQRSYHLLGRDKVHDRSFRIAPSKVGEELVDCFEMISLPSRPCTLRQKYCDCRSESRCPFSRLVEGLSVVLVKSK